MNFINNKNKIIHITLGIFIFLMVFLFPSKVHGLNLNLAVGSSKSFSYEQKIEEVVIGKTGYYRLETWGAQGGSQSYYGGGGGYSTGVVLLKQGEKIYVVVGGSGKSATAQGQSLAGGYNGGGNVVGVGGINHMTASGGGATHIAKKSGLLSSLSDSKSSILIVSGGGGGARNQSNHVSAARWGPGGSGGGYIGGGAIVQNNSSSPDTSVSGTQSKGNAFGQGGTGNGQSGGGGGFYGGYSGNSNTGINKTSYTGNGGAGSGYIANSQLISYQGIQKVMYCYSCPTSSTASTRTITTTNYSSIPTSYYAKTGDGAAKITFIEQVVLETRLKSLTVSGGVFDKPFDKDTYEYNVSLDSENYNTTIEAEPLASNAVVVGTGKYNIKTGTTDYNIVVTSEYGDVSTYLLHINRPPSSYPYLEDITIDNTSISDFSPTTLEYTVNLDADQEEVDLGGIPGRPNQVIDGVGKVNVPSGNSSKKIEVTSEDKTTSKTYTINFFKAHSSKLKSLKIGKYDLEPAFDPDTNEYDLNIMNSDISLNVDAIPYDEEATISLKGFGYIKTSTVATITVNEPNCSPTIYKIKLLKGGVSVPVVYDFPYKGEIQEFTAPTTGYYRLETWGAQGGSLSSAYYGGAGGYATGVILLKKNETVYIVVGGQGIAASGPGQSLIGGYNGGGGVAGRGGVNHMTASGGGATHIARTTGLLSSLKDDKNSILIVSGGGGGARNQPNHETAARWGPGGSGGGYIGGGAIVHGNTSSPITTVSGTQSYGYAFGQGELGHGNSGGGGGFYGGYSGNNNTGNTGTAYTGSGGAGSGYIASKELISYKEITKVMYCYNCKTISDDDLYTETTTNYSSSPTSYYAKTGDGHARITMFAQPSGNNFLSSITTDKGTLSPSFSIENLDYDVLLGPEADTITIGAKLEDDTATMTGIGTFDVPAGTTTFPITVTAENGDIRIYNVNVTRPASSNEKPIDIVISGLVPSLCMINSKYCNLDKEFDPNTHNYTLTVPSRIKQLEFTVIKGHKYQTVNGEGVINLEGGMNTITIEVISEDGTNTATYTYNIDRDMTGNAYIESLKVIDPKVDINFDPDITDYYFSIPNEYTNVELEIVLEDPKATYKVIGNENFEVGLNLVAIEVTAQNKEVQTYTLNIYREQSGNTFLKDLEVSHDTEVFPLNPTFNKVISNYTVNVSNEIEDVEIKATPEHSLTKITGLGKKNLKTGTNTYQLTSTAEDGSIQIYTVSIIRAKNSDATLKTLDILESSLDPVFESNTFEYDLDVNPGVASLNINAIPNNPLATYKIIGNSGFKVGVDNIVKIIVTAEDGTSNTYSIHVNRLPSTNTNLISLTTDKYDMTKIFNKEVTDYDIIVENEVDKIRVDAIAEDHLSTINGAGSYSLDTGNNDIYVTVIAEDNSMKTYTLHINRKQNSNTNLISLNTTSKTSLIPDFNKDEQNYNLFVENSEDKITVMGVTEVKTSVVSGNGEYALGVGDTTITLTVTAEDGTTKDYKIVVNRKPSSNANATSIIAKESVLDPIFDKSKEEYVLKVVESVTSLTLSVTLEDPTASYEVIGNEDFEIGNNTVIVKVTAEDGTVKNYQLNVLRQAAGTTSNRLEWLKTNKGSLSPSFDPDTNYYEVEVPFNENNITLTGELEDKNATVTGLTTYNLNVGQNILAVEVTSVEGIVRYYQVVVTRGENDEARLASLQVIGSNFTPNFNKDTYEYNLTTTQTDLNILATPIDTNATVQIIGGSGLTLGTNEVTIKVVAQDGITTKDYVIHVEKEKSNNNNLKSLTVEGETYHPEFSKTTTVYYLEVERDQETIQIEAIPEDVNATVTGDGEVELSIGVNYVEIVVESETGNQKVYTIIVTRNGSSNNYLESLTVSSGSLSPEFIKTTNDYKVVVPYEVEELTLSGFAEDPNAFVIGLEKYKLEVGKNKLIVTVQAEDGTARFYNIEVEREEVVSSQLEDLRIKNYELSIPFNKDVYDYNVVIDNEVTSLDITAIPIDKGATYKIIGNENFIVGMNTVEIIVTDRLGNNTSTYTLNVNRQSYSNTYLSYIYPNKGTLNPTFNKTTLTYTVEVEPDVNSINIAAEPEITTNTLTGTGDYSLENGSIKVPLVVTTPTGISRTYYVNVSKKLKENNHLESLVVKASGNVQTLTPSFDKEKLNYSATVDPGTPNISISATAEEGATIKGTGNKTLKLGENHFDIVVVAENGNERTYHLVVNRPASTNNFLTNLIPSVGTLEPSFDYTIDEYSIRLDSSVSLLSFEAVTEDIHATVTGIEKEVVPDGESTRKIVVTAEDGSEKIYTIHIYKDRTDEARLESLKVAGYTLNEVFDKDTFSYTLTVPNNKNVLLSSDVEAIPIDKNAKVSKTSSLVLSSTATNIYTIVVTAKDGFTTETYTIAIDREKGSDSTLSKLVFKNGELLPKFLPTMLEYTLKLPRGVTTISPADVEAIPTDRDASISLPPNFDLDSGDTTYEIVVESPDQSSTTTYVIHVERLESNDTSLKLLESSTGTFDPSFSKDKRNYTLNILDNIDEITLTAIPNDEKARIIDGVGVHTIDSSTKSIEITVQAEDGTIGIYTIVVEKSITTKTELDDLYLEGDCSKDTCPLVPSFSSEVFDYSATVESYIKNIDIVYQKKHPNQKVKIYNESTMNEIDIENISLKTGKNKFIVEVENEVGGKASYNITITKKPSSNNYLKSLKVTNTDVDLEFDKETLEYSITIPNELDKVDLDYETEDPTATATTSGTKYLTIGNNDVLITVTAEDLSTRTYMIHVVREGLENPYLQSLTVSSGVIYSISPKFNKTTTNYTVDVPAEVEKITLDAVAEDKTTTVLGTGEYQIKTGINKFSITTTTVSGDTMVYTVLVNRLKSTRLFLKELTPHVSKLNEEFTKTKFSYTMDVDATVKNLEFTVVPEISSTTYKIIGNKNLVTGKNTILIVLTSDDKTVTTTYKVEVTKKKSSDNYLKSLTVNNKELISSSNKEDTTFNVTVPYDVDIADVTAIPNISSSIVTGDGKYSLDYGNNEVKLTVTAEDLSTREYTLNIKREYDNNLLMISTNRGDLTPSFNKDTLDYYLDVEKEVEDITVLAVTSSNLTTVTGNGYHILDMGENLIHLVVLSTDGESKTYTLHINRKKSSNNYIKNLFVHEGFMKEEFDKENLEYHLEVPNDISSLTMDIELEDDFASYVVEGNEDLKLGNNTIKIKVIAEDGDVRVYTLEVLVDEASKFSNRLLDLKVNKGTLAPVFDPDTLTYTVTVPEAVKDITVSGVLESVEATQEGFETYNLKSGRNEIQVVVTSKDKKKRVYSIIVYRVQSSDARLKSVKFKEGKFSPLFDKDVEDYKMTIDSNIDSLTEEVEPLVEGTTYQISGNHNIGTGTTTVTIVATAEDKVTQKTYTFTVEKEVSKNNYLASLETNIGTILPEFDKTNTGPYTIDVDDTVNSLVLTGKAEDAKATVSGLGLHQINKGKNTILITVTSEANDIRTYTVIVNKSLSSDNDLLFLGVSDGDLNPEFDPSRTNYQLEVESDVEELTVLGIAKDKNATVSGNGVYNIGSEGQQIEVIVTAEDGTLKTYTIDVSKKELISSKLLDIRAHEGKLSPEFNKNEYDYMIKVPNEVTSLTLDITKEDESATYTVLDNHDFIIGTNQVKVVVTARDNTTSTYTLNVIRQPVANNYLKELTVSEGMLSPKFEKTTIYYEVEVPSTVSKINISGVAEDINSTVTGNGEYSLVTGDNYLYIDVTSSTGVLRTYTVKVVRKESNENSLINLSVDHGTLSPTFNPDINYYVVDFPEGINEIEIFAEANEKATITGTGKKKLTTGENRFEVVVTAENGDINTYEIIVNKASSSNTNILNIIPSSGTLDPSYINTIDSYEVIVEDDVAMIDFDVITESEFAKVSGDKNNYLNYGSNQITITVEAEDGSKKEVYINVIREKNITSIEVDKEQILIQKGDTAEIIAKVLPEDATNKELGWMSSDPLIATVDDGKVTGVDYGTVDITVYSIKNPEIKKTITVTVMNLKITSQVYEIRRDDEVYPYIIGAEQGELLSGFITHLDNNPSLLHFYSADGIEFTALENEKVKTGELVKLEYEGVVYDEVYIAVRGELDGDGEINIKDYNADLDHVLKRSTLEFYWFAVGNVEDEAEGIINIKDANKIKDKVLKRIPSLNPSYSPKVEP